MTSLVAINNKQLNPGVSKLHFSNFKSIHGLTPYCADKWTYLIANSVTFSDQLEHAIRLTKPDNQHLYHWLERIILGGQCGLLFVEQLDLDDVRSHKIRKLCEVYGVTLVNLTIANDTPDNLVMGPWH